MIDTRTVPYAALLLRVSMGLLFIAHGAIKLFVFTPAGTVAFFASLGLPAVAAWAVILAEILGGIALVLGFLTRWVALGLLPVMAGAALVHAGAGFMFSNQGGGWEFPVFWAATLLVQAMLGDGAHSLRAARA
ncbi:DoxX family protein [Geminicoccaceae bacterium 1502E]|nr:DoxX family protein [Geminicoccaceae bacterium 1502E]